MAMVALALLIATPSANADNKLLKKAQKKEYKQKMKEYKKDGWQIFGSSHSLDVALLTHYEKLSEEGVTEVMGQATSGDKRIGRDRLLMSACVEYAQKSGSHIKGRIVEDMGSVIGTDEAEEFNHFYEAYENAVNSEIKGELRSSYAVYRPIKKNGKDLYEFQAYYIVNENEASKARIRAFQNAAKESAVAQKYAEQVSDFIKEGF